MHKYKIVIQYDGSFFRGWQLQKNQKTVQGDIENALMTIARSKSRIIVKGSGRTDAGVHAIGQVAHFDLDTHLTENQLKNALNFYTDENCKIMSLSKTYDRFDSRFDAKNRTYKYQIYFGKSILYRNQAWIKNDSIDIKILNQLAEYLIGEHDFLSFSKYNPEMKNTRSYIFYSKWEIEKKMLTYKVCANRFMHHMIRFLVGTMVAVSENRFSIKHFKTLLHEPQKNVQIHRAPACGLQLLKVEYD